MVVTVFSRLLYCFHGEIMWLLQCYQVPHYPVTLCVTLTYNVGHSDQMPLVLPQVIGVVLGTY